jgi:hypothetical protein
MSQTKKNPAKRGIPFAQIYEILIGLSIYRKLPPEIHMGIMRKFFGLIALIFFISCSDDERPGQRNPNLLPINFQFTLDLSLPQYSQLQFSSNAVYVNGPNYGNAGVIVVNIGGTFIAFDAADPNHPPSACSVLAIDGLEGVCGCNDNNRYDLITGSPVTKGLEYPLLAYRVVDNGNGTITVSN